MLFAFFDAINKLSIRNTTQGNYNVWQENTRCTDTHFDPNRFIYVKRYIIKSMGLV